MSPSRGLAWRLRGGPAAPLLALAALVLLGVGAVAASAAPRAAPDPRQVRVRLADFVSGLDNPVALAAPADGSGRLFVTERAGRIRIIKDGSLLSEPFLDIRDRVAMEAGQGGLLGLAFHPDYARNGLLVVGYTAREPAGDIRYARFSVSADPDRADPASEALIVGWPHARLDHVAGDLKFGPDGYLYLATDDGGGTGDPEGNGQNPATLLGKVLRLDIDGGNPYRVPPDNPFVGDAAYRPEIWALGLRSPWRFGFDAGTGDLYVGDRGESLYEEINFQPAASPGAENYGWNLMEGVACTGGADCDKSGKVLPVVRYVHAGSCVAVVGGTVYRGRRYPELVGLYFYADNCLGVLVASVRNDQGSWESAQVALQRGIGMQSIGEDADGELYVVGSEGRVLRLVSEGLATPTSGTPAPTRPRPPTPTPTPGERQVAVVALDYSFRPNRLRADPDEVLVVQLANQGPSPHDIEFELDDFRVETSERVAPGQVTEISFYAPAVPGRYSFYCTVGDHRARGMSGVLEVGQCFGGCTTYLPRLDR